MSGYINSFLIEPVVRQARRFSFPYAEGADEPGGHGSLSESHASDNDHPRPSLHPLRNGLSLEAESQPSNSKDAIDGRIGNVRPSLANFGRFRWSYATHPDPLPADDNTSSWFSPRILQSARYYTPRNFPFFGADADDSTVPDTRVSSPMTMEELASQDSDLERHTRETIDGLDSMSLDDERESPQEFPTTMSVESAGLVRTRNNSSSSSPAIRSGSNRSSRRGTGQGSTPREHSFDASGLPADDGMRVLREKMHQIRAMALSSEEKAKQMHALMIADYNTFKQLQTQPEDPRLRKRLAKPEPQRFNSLPSFLPERSPLGEAQLPIAVNAEDRQPTYHPSSSRMDEMEPGLEDEERQEELILGCQHYMRNVKIQCFDCDRWYTCRHCHDGMESHLLDRKMTQNMLCMLCGTAQRAGEYCRQCGELTAAYYCDICKLWDNDATKSIYHCSDCGICRKGEGLGKDYIHCKKCNVCISIAWAPTHRCVERATECDCPICGDYMFTSFASVVAMKCGHYIHRTCYDEYMQRSYKCPICNCSAVNMELQWRKLDWQIQGQPMPEQYRDTKAWVSCNDCGAKTCTAFHWLGNKCTVCDSYNTNKLSLVNIPSSQIAERSSTARQDEDTSLNASNLSDVDDARAERNLVGADAGASASRTSIGDFPESLSTGHTTSGEEAPNISNEAELSDAIARSAEPSPAGSLHNEDNMDTHWCPSSNAEEILISDTALSQSPSSSTAIGSAPSPAGLAKGKSPTGVEIGGVGDDDDMSVIGDELEEVDGDDDVGFWGEAISPAGWGISPPAWASPSFLATRWFKEGDENGDVEEEHERENENESEEEDEEEEESDEDVIGEEEVEEGDDDMELFGHR